MPKGIYIREPRGKGSYKHHDKAAKRLRPYEALYNLMCREAGRKRRRSPVTIDMTYEEFVEFTSIEECHYCGAAVKWATHHVVKNGASYHLDRRVNTAGYSVLNCVVCCSRCNRAKSNHFTYDEWLQIGKLIRSWEK